MKPREGNQLSQGHIAHWGRIRTRTWDPDPSCRVFLPWQHAVDGRDWGSERLALSVVTGTCWRTGEGWIFYAVLVSAPVPVPFLLMSSVYFQPAGPRGHSRNLKVFTASLSGLRQARKQMRAAFLFLDCSPCNLEVQTVTAENRKTISGAHLKTILVWGLSVMNPDASQNLLLWNQFLRPVWAQRGSFFSLLRGWR